MTRAISRASSIAGIDIVPAKSDDVHFVEMVQGIVRGASLAYQPTDMFIVQIDHWFGERWRNFSGKILGAVGIRDLGKGRHVPPFHPHRVFSQHHYRWDAGKSRWFFQGTGIPLHRYQSSMENVTQKDRLVRSISDSSMLVWYSGRTLRNTPGSLMVYVNVPNDALSWYVSFEKDDNWKANKLVGISKAELLGFQESGHR